MLNLFLAVLQVHGFTAIPGEEVIKVVQQVAVDGARVTVTVDGVVVLVTDEPSVFGTGRKNLRLQNDHGARNRNAAIQGNVCQRCHLHI